MRKKKRILSFLLAVAMMFGCLMDTSFAFAQESEPTPAETNGVTTIELVKGQKVTLDGELQEYDENQSVVDLVHGYLPVTGQKIQNGQYLILASTDSGYYAVTNEIKTDVSPNGLTLKSVDINNLGNAEYADYVWTVNQSGENYTLQDVSGNYTTFNNNNIGLSSTVSNVAIDEVNDEYRISYDDGNKVFNNYGGRNSGTSHITGYAGTAKGFLFYEMPIENAKGVKITALKVGTTTITVDEQVYQIVVKYANEKLSTNGMTASVASGVTFEERDANGNGAYDKASSDVTESYIFDGNNKSFWTGKTSKADDRWLMVDLKGEYIINQIDYTPRYDNGEKWKCSGNAQTLIIEVSKDGEKWTAVTGENGRDLAAHVKKSAVLEGTEWYPEKVFFTPTRARYVRISGEKTYHYQGSKEFITVADLAFYEVTEVDHDSESTIALDKAISASEGAIFGSNDGINGSRGIAKITDNIIPPEDADANYCDIGDGNRSDADVSTKSYFQIDLGKVYEVDGAKLYRYWKHNPARNYGATVILASKDENFEQYEVLYNSDSNNVFGLNLGNATEVTYQESNKGKRIFVTDELGNRTTVDAQYVRVYVHGQNHIVEFQVFGREIVKADYTAVDAAIREANARNRNWYTPESLAELDAAIEAVDRDKKASEQSKVDAMVVAIRDAITALVEKGNIEDRNYVSYYSFDNVTEGDTKVEDLWCNRDGKLKGTAKIVANGVKGKALSVETACDGVIVDERENILTGDWTIAYWVNPASLPNNAEVSVLEDKDQHYSFSLQVGTGNTKNAPGFRIYQSGGTNNEDQYSYNSHNFEVDKWYHIAWVRKGNSLGLYINGVENKTNNSAWQNSYKVPCDVIGGNGFTGLIDEVKVFSKGLTGSQIKSMMEADITDTNLKFKSVSISLHDDITVNYKVDKAVLTGYNVEDAYVEFEFNGNKTKVEADTSQSGDYLVFKLEGVGPQYMNDTIKATLCAKKDGVTYKGAVQNYSVYTYLTKVLDTYSDDANAKIRTLVVDLLNYGSAAQTYISYNTDVLANRDVTTEQQENWAGKLPEDIASVKDVVEEKENATVHWYESTLLLADSVEVCYYIRLDDGVELNGLSMKAVVEDGTNRSWTISEFGDPKEVTEDDETFNVYPVYFGELNAADMRAEILTTIYSEGQPVSDTVSYSIESYVHEILELVKDNPGDNGELEKLVDLVSKMLTYGCSARNYVSNN